MFSLHESGRGAIRLRTGVAALAALVFSLAPFAPPSQAQDSRFFRIGTGSISGVYFPVGGLLSGVISRPPGSRACAYGGSCGVEGLIAIAQATSGSIANVRGVAHGNLEAAMAQADVVWAAFKGNGPFKAPLTGLRAITNLYAEAVHIVVRDESGIGAVSDLAGRRVSLDLEGSGTRGIARLILKSHGVDLAKIRQRNSQIGPAVDRLRNGGIDAFFFVGGLPAPALAILARDTRLRLLPVGGKKAEAIRDANSFLFHFDIPAEAYQGIGATPTLAVNAMLVVSERIDEETVYGITSAIWHPQTQQVLAHGHAAAQQITIEKAIENVAIPLHAGAERYYRETGRLRDGALPTGATMRRAAPPER